MKERIKSIDSLRTLAILGVLLIHTTTRTLEASKFNITAFSWTLFLNQVARFAVPLFFIISGFVLELSFKEESFLSFIKRRLAKIFIPYVFWSLIYYFLVYNHGHNNLFYVILTGDASYQLYFIPTLCIFYLLFPVIHKFSKIILNKFLISLIFISQLYLLYLDYFVKEFKFSDPVHIAILAYFFFMIGIFAAKNKIKLEAFISKIKFVLPILASISGLYVFWEGRNRYLATENYLSYYSQWRPSVLIYTIFIALTFYYFFEYTGLKNSVISKFSKHSFFVFFAHVVILETLWQFPGKYLFNFLTLNFVGKIIFDLVFFGLVTFLSFTISFFVHKTSRAVKYLG